MKSNPGGQLPVDEILGRDALIAELWDILARTSVVMTAERRIGKTSIIRKMHANPGAGWVPVLQDLERIYSADEFAVAIYKEIYRFLSSWQKATHSATKLWKEVGGVEIGGVLKLPENKQKHWKTLLVQGEGLTTSDLPQAARTIAVEGDCFPFYIHSIVRTLRISGRMADPEQIVEAVKAQLTHVNDPWELGHYRSRIKSYYPKEDEVITAVLDFLATCESPATIDQVFSAVKSRETFDDRERLMEVLKLLQRDHYLDRSSDGRYSFRFPLICRWWKLDRGL
jgi:hypothetical protein